MRKETTGNDAFEGKKVTYGRGPRIDQERADFDQGRTNACGTTALAIALHKLGKDVPVAEIDKSIRNFNLFTSSEGIKRYAQGAGFQAERYDKGSFEQLQRDLGAGREVIVLTDVGGRDSKGYLQPGSGDDTGLHYMHVTEVGTDQNGQQYVTFNNWGHQETLPYTEFEKLWTDLHFKGLDTGYERHYLLVDKGDAERASRVEPGRRVAHRRRPERRRLAPVQRRGRPQARRCLGWTLRARRRRQGSLQRSKGSHQGPLQLIERRPGRIPGVRTDSRQLQRGAAPGPSGDRRAIHSRWASGEPILSDHRALHLSRHGGSTMARAVQGTLFLLTVACSPFLSLPKDDTDLPADSQSSYRHAGCEDGTYGCPQDLTFYCAAGLIEARHGACRDRLGLRPDRPHPQLHRLRRVPATVRPGRRSQRLPGRDSARRSRRIARPPSAAPRDRAGWIPAPSAPSAKRAAVARRSRSRTEAPERRRSVGDAPRLRFQTTVLGQMTGKRRVGIP